MQPATTLREAAKYLEELAGPNPKAWRRGVNVPSVCIPQGVGYAICAIPDNRAAQLIALHDPQTVFLLADVLSGLADAAEDGIEPEPGWLSYAEAVLFKRDNQGGSHV